MFNIDHRTLPLHRTQEHWAYIIPYIKVLITILINIILLITIRRFDIYINELQF